MNRQDLISSYIEFFKSKNHKEIPNSSLVPLNDPTVLFTTAGMHPLVPFLLGEKYPLGKRLVNVQKCIRTGDIESVGDDFHLTFFEMLGNWSLGDYFKEDAIKFSFEFLTKTLRIPVEKLSVTCFAGDNLVPKDAESAKIWEKLGIKKESIRFLGKNDNWWGPAGNTGPCGPDTEMFVNDCEIWNDVFMQYNKNKSGKYEQLIQKNVDTGMGVERTLAILDNLKSVYETPCFLPIIKGIEKISKKSYKGNEKAMRIIADHIKASIFILADGVLPSNVERGYVLRRLIRRVVRFARNIGIKDNFASKLVPSILQIYPDYQELKKNEKMIIRELNLEEERFRKTLEQGISIFEKIAGNKKQISGKDAFLLYQSYGFPIEMTLELAKENKIKIDTEGFNKENKKHQELSRTAGSGTYKSGLADSSEKTTKLHTATHLLNEALRVVLKDKNIKQKGSNITPERLRFDFSFSRKLAEKEIKQVEDLVNKKIKENIPVKKQEMKLEKALKSAQGEFGAKYPEIVSVYSIADFSREICAGPHAERTGKLGKFKIIKEEGVAAGVRRIKAILE